MTDDPDLQPQRATEEPSESRADAAPSGPGRASSRGRVLAYIGKKVATAALTVLVASIVVFLVVEVLPQDPALHALGREATAEQRAAFRARMHLDDPPLRRYLVWLSGMARLDFGQSVISGQPIKDQLLTRLSYTALLAISSLLLAIAIALPLAVFAAQRAGRLVDVTASAAAIAISALPEFVLGIGLLLILASTLKLVPVASTRIVEGDLRALVMPTLTLALGVAAYVFRLARVSVVETMSAPFVRTAILNGFSPRRTLWRHIMPNASVVVVNVVALNAIFLLSGVIVVENVFAYPGLGKLLVDAIGANDFTVIEGVAVLTAALLVIVNLLADGVVLVLDPRLRGRI